MRYPVLVNQPTTASTDFISLVIGELFPSSILQFPRKGVKFIFLTAAFQAEIIFSAPALMGKVHKHLLNVEY